MFCEIPPATTPFRILFPHYFSLAMDILKAMTEKHTRDSKIKQEFVTDLEKFFADDGPVMRDYRKAVQDAIDGGWMQTDFGITDTVGDRYSKYARDLNMSASACPIDVEADAFVLKAFGDFKQRVITAAPGVALEVSMGRRAGMPRGLEICVKWNDRKIKEEFVADLEKLFADDGPVMRDYRKAVQTAIDGGWATADIDVTDTVGERYCKFARDMKMSTNPHPTDAQADAHVLKAFEDFKQRVVAAAPGAELDVTMGRRAGVARPWAFEICMRWKRTC